MRIAPAVVALAAVATMARASQSTYRISGGVEREGQLVLAAEDAYVAAEVSRDEAALRRLVDDRFVYNAVDGTTSGKEELIRSVLRMNMTGQTISERSVMRSVYVKRGKVWRMLRLHMQPRSTR